MAAAPDEQLSLCETLRHAALTAVLCVLNVAVLPLLVVIPRTLEQYAEKSMINTLVLIGSIFFVVLFLIITMFDTGQSVELKDDGDSPDVVTTLESQSLPVVD